jgi:broad specificity phosphatase PhoE
MGTLYLIRHGQASFGADDYDQLSPLGRQQAVRLGEYLRPKLQNQPIEAVMMGSLKRHRQTWEGIAEGAGLPHTPAVWPGLNEYDSEALIRAIHPGPLAKPDTPEVYRAHFRLLRDALTAWMQGRSAPVGMPAYADWVAGITGALDHVRQHHGAQADAQVLVLSSGGPISTAVGQVLGTPPETTIELNLRLRNSAVTELVFTPKRHVLSTFNHVPHLDQPGRADWITYA